MAPRGTRIAGCPGMATPIQSCPDCVHRRRGFLSRLSPESLERAMCLMRPRRYPAGTVLGSEGEVPEGVHAIQKGLVKLAGEGPRGHTRIVDLLGPGDVLGLGGVFGRRLS